MQNTRTGGYGTEIGWKGQERNDPQKKYKQRAEHFKKIKSFWENCSDGKHSVCKTTQMPQKEKNEIGSKEWRNLTPPGKTDSGHVTERKTSNIDKIFKDDKSICSGLDRSQNIIAPEMLQNLSLNERQPEERPEITSTMNMLHGGNQFETTLRRLHLHETLCLR